MAPPSSHRVTPRYVNQCRVKRGWRISLGALGCMATAVLLVGLTGCASKPVTSSKSKVSPAEVKIYQTTDLLASQYTLVEYVWISSWHSNLTYPTFKSEASGIDAMKRIASDAGANGLINVICLDGRAKASQSLELYCYGDAIRVN
jgi:hypothetical protein